MEVAGVELGWSQLLAVGWLVAMALAYWIRAFAQVGRSPFAHLFFHLGLLGGLAAVFAPARFEPASAWWVERSGLPAAVREADRRIAAVEALPGQLWDALVEPFRDLLGEEPEPPPIVVPLTPVVSAREPGALETAVVPAVEDTVLQLLRLTAFATCAVVMITAFLLRSTTSNASALRDLRRRVADLEAGQPSSPEG